MLKKNYQSYYTYRKELYSEINKKWNIKKRKLLRKYTKFQKSHTSLAKVFSQNIMFFLMISIILNTLLWFQIIPNSAEEVKLMGLISGLSYMIIILAPLSRWIFPKNFKMQDAMILQGFMSLLVAIINSYSLGILG